jgi:MFS family permease
VQSSESPWRVFALLAGATLVGTLNFSFVFVAFNDFEETFNASAEATSWTLTAYSITLASLMVPGGWLADRFGRKRIFLIGVALLSFGSILVACAPRI